MNHLKEIQEYKLEILKQTVNKDELQCYYDTHTYKEAAQYYREVYGCSIKNFKILLEYFKIERKGAGFNLSHDREKVKQGMIDKYGVDNAQKVVEIKERTKQTCLEKYGVDNVSKAEEIQNKIKQTNLNKYGVENVYQAEEVKDKIKQKCLDEYGVEYYSQVESVKDLVRKSKLERYGDPNYHNIEQMKQTKLVKYGSAFYSNRAQAKQTCLERYGVENATQCREIHIRMSEGRKKKSIASDGTKLDSGWEVLVYEYALQKGYTIERQIPISYGDKKTFIDFRINGQLYEVKGTHLLNDCWENKGVLINEKIQCYRDNNITIITDISYVKTIVQGLAYIDIHDLNF